LSHVWLLSGVGAVGLAMFFALAGGTLRCFSRSRLEDVLARRGQLRRLDHLLEHYDELLRTTVLLHILCLIAWAALAEAWAVGRFGGGAAGWLIGGGLAAVVGVTVAGIIPMAWAQYAAESVLAVILPALLFFRAVFLPAQRLLGTLDGLVRRLAGVTPDVQTRPDIEEEIRSVISEGEREGAIEEDQKEMIEGVIEFKKADVTEIMTPRTDIVSIEADALADEARRRIAESGHSRLPVTENDIDSIVGILYAKDLLLQGTGGGREEPQHVRNLMRPPLFVPETKRLDKLLSGFRRAKVHMAIVLDEYGGTAGLVTVEDIVEEIFGEIVDEYEEVPPQPICRIADRMFEVEARVHIDELNDDLSLHLPEDEDYETIGGFVLSRLGHIPKAGEVLERDGLRITVLEAEARRITRLRLELTPDAPRVQES